MNLKANTPRMHTITPFWDEKFINFLGRSTAPLQTPPPRRLRRLDSRVFGTRPATPPPMLQWRWRPWPKNPHVGYGPPTPVAELTLYLFLRRSLIVFVRILSNSGWKRYKLPSIPTVTVGLSTRRTNVAMPTHSVYTVSWHDRINHLVDNSLNVDNDNVNSVTKSVS